MHPRFSVIFDAFVIICLLIEVLYGGHIEFLSVVLMLNNYHNITLVKNTLKQKNANLNYAQFKQDLQRP